MGWRSPVRTRPSSVTWIRVLITILSIIAISYGPGALPATAQLGRIGDAARRAADAAKREAEELARKKEKEKEAPPATAPAPAPPSASPATPAAGATPASGAQSTPAPSFEAYSKYDFVPGEKVVALDDFTQDEIGDFPAKWNTNGSGEVVTLAGKPGRWLKVTRGGFFIPDFVSELPENFTLEFDFTVAPTFDSSYALNVALAQIANPKQPAAWQSSANLFTLTLNPRPGSGSSGMTTRQDETSGPANNTILGQLISKSTLPFHISIWRQRQRVRVYVNQEKTWDVPRALTATAKLNSLVFFLPNVDAGMEYYFTNVRFATGAPDTRNKILTQGKWVSHGILFDVNSDRLKGESYGSLKEIATVLTENADLKVQIVGHTDSDGDDKSNLDLSRRRAASVKNALATQFQIDAARMETDGKGESEPVDKNDTPAGKANNRRVEFIKR
jgi:outer membrane protein OmpA-like peptidoglycan-associated protein